jgi:hypothetical protein
MSLPKERSRVARGCRADHFFFDLQIDLSRPGVAPRAIDTDRAARSFSSGSCIRKGGSLDLFNRRERKTLPLAGTDESSEGLTGGVGRCDVGRIRYGLKQANAKNLDLPCTDDPKPTSEGTSIDRMDKVSEF